MSNTIKTVIVILFILVFLSLGLNLYLYWQLLRAQQAAQTLIPEVQQILAQAATDVESFQNSTFEFEIEIDQEFPVDVEIPIQETVEVPIQMTVPIQQEFETTIELDPFGTGSGIQMPVKVPVDVEVPLDVVVPVAIDQTIPISTTIPLDITLPVAIEVNKTGLATSVEQLHSALVSFNQFFDAILVDIHRLSIMPGQ